MWPVRKMPKKLSDFISLLPLPEKDTAAFCADPIGYLNQQGYPTDSLPRATSAINPTTLTGLSLVRELRALLAAHAVPPDPPPDPVASEDTPIFRPPPTAPALVVGDDPAAPIESYATGQMADTAPQSTTGLPFPEFAAAFERRDLHRMPAPRSETSLLAASPEAPLKPSANPLLDASAAGPMVLKSIVGPSLTESGDMTAEAVIMADDRVQVMDSSILPFSWLCRLEITAANGTRWLGTGWFISPSVIVTAGHCVFLHNHGGWVQSIAVFVGQNRDQYDRAMTVTHYASTRGWLNNRDTVHDYGVLFATPGDQGFFGYGVLGDAVLYGALANITGYPQDKPTGTLWGHAKRLQPPHPQVLQYEIDTFGGMSGAPVVMWDGQDYVATGIHNYGGAKLNTASRLTEQVFYNFERWKSLGDSN